MSDWINVLKGEVPAEKIDPLIKVATQSLKHLLASEPKTEGRVIAILERHLAGQTMPTTWDSTLDALERYLGEDLTYFVAWSTTQLEGQTENLDRVKKIATREVVSFLQVILAIHGAALAQAFSAWKELPHDWESLFREVFHDQINETYRINVRIRKYNQEEIPLEGSPTSFLNLSRTLLEVLRSLRGVDAFAEDQINAFLSEACAFAAACDRTEWMRNLLSPPPNDKPKGTKGRKSKK